MTLAPDDSERLRGSIAGLRQGLDALTDEEGFALPQMAEMLRMSEVELAGTVSRMRWLLEILERIERREAA